MGFNFMGPNLGNPALRALQYVMVDGVKYRVRQTYADPVHECVLVEFTPVAVVSEIIGRLTTTDLVALHGPDPFVGRLNRAVLVASELDLYEALAELIRGDRVAYQRGNLDARRSSLSAGVPHAPTPADPRSTEGPHSEAHDTQARDLHVVPPGDLPDGSPGHGVLQRDVSGPGAAVRPGTGAGSPHGARVRARRRAARAVKGASDLDTSSTRSNPFAAHPTRSHDDHVDAVPPGILEQATQPTVWPSWGFIALIVLLGVGALLFELWAARA
jgi:hypothetical protein